jgi:hypothetical protein
MAHRVIHSLRQILAPGCVPLFTSDGLNLYFSAALRPFWILAQDWSPGAESPSAASGGQADIRSVKEKLSTSQTRASHASDAALNIGRSHGRETSIGPLWMAEHPFHRRAPCHPRDPAAPSQEWEAPGKQDVTLWRLTSPGTPAILIHVGCARGGSTLIEGCLISSLLG